MTTQAPAVATLRLLGGFQVSQALYVAARAGVADRLLDGPVALGVLADSVGLRPDPLRRILRVLGSEDVFAFDQQQDVVALGPLGHTLVTGGADSVRSIALAWMETHYAPFAELWGTATTGVPAAELAFGRPFFDWLGQDSARTATFTAAMADFTLAVRRHAFSRVELDGVGTVVDVGGADGTVLAGLAERYPAVRGVVFDLPHVVRGAEAVVRARGVGDRISVVGGDFFVEVPSGDCYLACFVLHDWSDEQAARILARIREAAAVADARLVLVETVLDVGPAPQVAQLLDLTMLGLVAGRERTTGDWRRLLAGSGFRLERVRVTEGPMCVIEARRLP
ncbi:methyltransferase [Kitasatospora sp. NPDC089913]|uniref:methyltransferase n=1 Tax=Kitasatospora sp. NPDC089913 TaxID=3364080 RepID=UPI003814338E